MKKQKEIETEERINVICPDCGNHVWDVATVDQHLNKCWNCGLRFFSDCE